MGIAAQVVRGTQALGWIWREESNRDQRVRRLCMSAAWQAWKRTIRKPITVTLFNGKRFRAYPDCTCSSSAFYYKIPNRRCLESLRTWARHGTFIDIGANVGLISMLLADVTDAAILFEPNPIAAARARENVQLNQLSFEVHEIALSDENGTIALEDRGGVDTCNRTTDQNSSIRARTVQRKTLDQVLAERGGPSPPVTLVKIDVEGHENWVLRGMRKLLLTQRPVVMFEYLERTDLKQVFDLFAQSGYQVMTVSEDGSLARASLNVAPLQDLIAIPFELTSARLSA